MTDAGDHGSTEYYVNRELSWFSFLERVLSEGVDSRYGAEERGKFLGIVSGSLDEFFAIRLSTLLRQKKEFPELKDICGFTAEEQIRLVLKRAGEFLVRADHVADSYVNYNVMSTSRGAIDDVMSTISNLINRIVPFNPAKIRSESVNIILKSRDGASRFLLPLKSPEERVVVTGADKTGAGTVFLLEDILKARGDLLPDYIDPSTICVFKAVRDRDEIYPGTPNQKNMANWLKDLETAGFVCCILQNTASEDTKAFLADTLALSRDAIFESKYV
nr:hypothetical protein [Lachnospiraceae bacterium]